MAATITVEVNKAYQLPKICSLSHVIPCACIVGVRAQRWEAAFDLKSAKVGLYTMWDSIRSVLDNG